MGIDPGTSLMGYGIVHVKKNKLSLVCMGVINLKKYTDHAQKLQHIFRRCTQLIDEYNPDELAVEAPFFGKNVQSMLKLGRAQGVAFAAALNRDIPVIEYAPRKIKQSVTGNGAASKEQVAGMLQSILMIPQKDMPKDLDATDGVAAAVCHHYQSRNQVKGKSYSGWDAFLKANPERKG